MLSPEYIKQGNQRIARYLFDTKYDFYYVLPQPIVQKCGYGLVRIGDEGVLPLATSWDWLLPIAQMLFIPTECFSYSIEEFYIVVQDELSLRDIWHDE